MMHFPTCDSTKHTKSVKHQKSESQTLQAPTDRPQWAPYKLPYELPVNLLSNNSMSTVTSPYMSLHKPLY